MAKFYLDILKTVADIYFGVAVSLLNDFWRTPS